MNLGKGLTVSFPWVATATRLFSLQPTRGWGHLRNITSISAVVVLLICAASSAPSATLGPSLTSKLTGLADSASIGTVIVSFNTSNGLNASHLATLTAAGITKGYTLKQLGMVGAPATAGQVRALASNSAIRSIWLNDRMMFLNNQTRVDRK